MIARSRETDDEPLFVWRDVMDGVDHRIVISTCCRYCGEALHILNRSRQACCASATRVSLNVSCSCCGYWAWHIAIDSDESSSSSGEEAVLSEFQINDAELVLDESGTSLKRPPGRM